MAKGMGGVAARVEQLVRPVVEQAGCTLWDVRYEKEGSGWYLRVLIDRADGPMDTDTCEKVSRAIDPLLDAEDPVPQAYFLEVGSPGLGRMLTRSEHFEQLRGQKVRAHLIRPDDQGRKEVAGLLQDASGGMVLLVCDGEEIQVPEKAASSFRLCDDESLF